MPAGADLAARFRELPKGSRAQLERTLRESYFTDRAEFLASDAGRRALEEQLGGRLRGHRERIVPWLDAAGPLAGAEVLEIGCGTGSSTVALAEQGANVTAVDVHGGALAVARERCGLYGVNARFLQQSGCDVAAQLADAPPDLVLFYASLEHMTVAERLAAMRSTWDLLPSGGLWCLAETPNRLWYHDSHSSDLPFFLWLPDDLAKAYARFSPRPDYAADVVGDPEEPGLRLFRRGRGVSYHEFELALGRPARELPVVSSLQSFRGRRRQSLWRRLGLKRRRPSQRYRDLLQAQAPGLHPGFLEEYLDLILRKP